MPRNFYELIFQREFELNKTRKKYIKDILRVDANGGEMKPLGLKSLINEVTGLASVPVRCTELAVRH